MAAREAAAIPFPREDTTPPVTNTYFVIAGNDTAKGFPKQITLIIIWFLSCGIQPLALPVALALLGARKCLRKAAIAPAEMGSALL
jgi:hypothetical protein